MSPFRSAIIATTTILACCAGWADAAYDRNAARNYTLAWWNSDLGDVHHIPPPDGFADYINSPLHCTTCPYTWQYWENRDPNVSKTNDGDNTISEDWAADCTNFVSQSLIAGGITINGPGRGGTHVSVVRLGAALKTISQVTQFESAAGAPANLTTGDVVQWNKAHMTIVVAGSGSGVTLAMHSSDDASENLDHMFTRMRLHHPGQTIIATAYHITGSVIQGSLDSAPPTVVVKNASGQAVPDGGFVSGNITVEVSDSGSGIEAFEVTANKPLLDRAQEVFDGSGEYIFVDPNSNGVSKTYAVDLSAVAEGTMIFVKAFSVAGNISLITRFTIARTPPTLAVQSGQGQLPIYAVTNDNSIIGTATHNPAPVGEINVFQDGNPYNVPVAFTGSDATFGYQFDPRHWYWVQACDVAINCSLAAFCIESPSGNYCQSSNVPPPPAAPQGGTP